MAMQSENPPSWTLEGFRQGALEILPLMPGLFAFGLAFGTVAARKGFTLLDALAMSGTVYAGVAQLVVLETWPDRLTLPVIGGIVLVTALISSRFLLIGASLRPWLGSQPAVKIYPSLFLLVEPNWLMSMRYRANGGSDPAYLLGGGVVIYFVWVVSTAAGYALGTSIGDPHTFGIDMVMPAFFVAMLISMWRGFRTSSSMLIGGGVAIAVDFVFGGLWYLIVGALAGCVAGGFIDDRE
ncbi:MAG TPA: AzlC family ABC transporter permease [Pseudolabrys sp.]